MKVTHSYLRQLIREEIEGSKPTAPGTSTPTGEDPESTLGGAVEKMSPKKAQEMASGVFKAINSGKIGNAKSTINSLQATAAGRIALAVQALVWYGNADASEINSNASIIRKMASSVSEPPE